MMKKIIDFCDQYDMLPKGETVLIAVSGGKDSVFLLYVLAQLRIERNFEIACAHFDHSLRGEESDRDARFVRALCDKLGILCYVGKEDVSAFAKAGGLGIEEAARRLRYAFLEKTAEEIGATRIATAHTADDNLETLLLNLARGTGLRGLSGIPPVRGKIIRPLLETASREIVDFLEQNEIQYVEDATNEKDDYTRNRLRHHVVPALREISPGLDENALRCMSLLRADEAFLSSLAEEFIKKHVSGNSLPVQALAALPGPVAGRVLQHMAGGGLSYRHIAAILGICKEDKAHAKADVPGMRVWRDYDKLFFGAVSERSIPEIPLIMGETIIFEEAKLQISSESLSACDEINNSDNTFCFQRGSICGSIIVRPRKEGDSIRLAGRNGTKTLKKLFSEKRLNGVEKNLVPVLCDDEGPIAVYGFGISARCIAKPGDDVVRVRISQTI